MRPLTWLGFALVLAASSCASRSARRPPNGPPPGTGFGAPPIVAPSAQTVASVLVPPPPPPPVAFTELPPLAFKNGAPLKLSPVVKSVYHLYALSPDARSWIASAPQTPDGKLELDAGPHLFTRAFPQGVKVDVGVPSARFHPDGGRVLIWGYGGGLAVLDVPTGKTLWQRDGAVCNARFDGPDQIVFHESSKDPDAHLWRVTLSSKQATRLGAARVSDFCEANADGSAWIAHLDDVRAYVDGRTGAALPLRPPANVDVALSKGANRYCTGGEAGLSCVRLPDGGVENVWSRATSADMDFDPDGQHALIRYVRNPAEGIYDGWAFVDFVARTVRPLVKFKATSGSLFVVHPAGKLISIGSGRGAYVYDMERGVVRFAAHAALYDNMVDANLPRRLVIGTDNVEDVFYVDIP